MYYQIKVAENYQYALWRDNTDKKIVNHMIKVYIFGYLLVLDSPCITNWVIEKTASDQSSQYENEIIETIKQSFYMDDYLDCFASQ